MYEQFFGFSERPFDLTPSPRDLVLIDSQHEVLHNIESGIGRQATLTVVLGRAGSGKTTLIRAALARQPVRVHSVHFHNPILTRPEFVRMLVSHFGLSERAARSNRKFRNELRQVLLERRSRGEMTALIVDEAQSLPVELLEEIRLLANLEQNSETLLTVIIAGQPELADRLNHRRLRKLRKQVGVCCELRPFSPRETAAFLAGRIRAAGGTAARVFTLQAVALIHEESQGLPRLVSVIADNALMAGYAVVERPVGSDIVREICRDSDIQAAPRRSIGRPSVLQTARNAVSSGRRFNGTAIDAMPPVAAVHEAAPTVTVVPEPAIEVEVAQPPAASVPVLQEPAVAAAVFQEPLPEPVQQLAIAIELVEQPATAVEVVLQPAAQIEAVQDAATPDMPDADPNSADDDEELREIKEAFFNTYFEKVWVGPQVTDRR